MERPEVEEAFGQWRQEHAGTGLAYDDIEREIDELEAAGVVNRIVAS